MELSLDLFTQLLYATGIGVLIGLERSVGHDVDSVPCPEPEEAEASTKPEGAEPAVTGGDTEPGEPPPRPRFEPGETLGVRTFAVLSLVGFAAALAADAFPLVAPITLAAVAMMVFALYRRATEEGLGITTEVAAIGACGLGILCHHNPHAAGVLALVITVVLASKRFTHQTIAKMRRVEVTDTLKFLVIILIVLPLLPNETWDPYGAFNPYKVGLLVVLISGIGFVGYFLTRILGAQRGLGLTGVVGGLTSSTAVTAAMAAEARERPELRSICAFATVVANATMFIRVLVVVAVLAPDLMVRLLWSVGGMAVAAAGAGVVLWLVAGKAEKQRGGENPSEVQHKNPFSLGPALKFGAFFVGILFVARIAQQLFGDEGLYAAAGLSGLADVDAITLSIAEQVNEGTLALGVGSIGVTIAVVANSVVKTGIALYSGGWKFGSLVGLCLGIATVVGLTAAFVVP